jgi:hypothetical protein
MYNTLILLKNLQRLESGFKCNDHDIGIQRSRTQKKIEDLEGKKNGLTVEVSKLDAPTKAELEKKIRDLERRFSVLQYATFPRYTPVSGTPYYRSPNSGIRF